MAEIPESSQANQPSSDTEDTSEPELAASALIPSFPTGRVKRIMGLDADIKKVSSEAVFMISLSTELFIEFLAKRAGNAVAAKKRKSVKLEDLRTAITGHFPTADFLLDCLPHSSKLPAPLVGKKRDPEKPPPDGLRRIDAFFSKPGETNQ